MATQSYQDMLSQFNSNSNYGASTTGAPSTGLAANTYDSMVPEFNANNNYSDAGAGLTGNSYNYQATVPGAPAEQGGFMEGIKDGLGNEALMGGIMGAGQLGLGLANYLSMKPVYEEQLAGLKQNRQFAADDQARQQRTRTNFDNATQTA